MKIWAFLLLFTVSETYGLHKYCAEVTPVQYPAAPYTGRWYVYATTSCYDESSTKFRYGLFNNKISKCEYIDFYSNGKSYEQNIATHFIDYCYNDNIKQYDITSFDYYSVQTKYGTNDKLAIYVSEVNSYYEDKQINHDSKSSSSSEEKKNHNGKQKFFFSVIADTPEYKVIYVCSKFHTLTKDKPIVWILTKKATPDPATINFIKGTCTSNKIDFYDKLTFVNHSGCNYLPAKETYGPYSYKN